VAYSKLPVRLIGHHSGITFGFYGTSHHATEDIAIMRSLAGLTVMAPTDPAMLSATLRASVAHQQPMYIRIGRGREPQVYTADQLSDFQVGRAIWIEHGVVGTVIATGSMVAPSLAAVRELRSRGLDVGLLDMHTLKPLDTQAVREAAVTGRIVTVEEHNIIGGLGAAVAEALAETGSAATLYRHGIRDQYSLIGPPTHLYAHYQLDAPGIARVVEHQIGATGDER
jgi:transketolase